MRHLAPESFLRDRDVQINIHHDAIQALGNPKQGSSFVVLHGSKSDDYEPYQKSHGNFTMETHDHEVITLLRAWVDTQSLHACMYSIFVSMPLFLLLSE